MSASPSTRRRALRGQIALGVKVRIDAPLLPDPMALRAKLSAAELVIRSFLVPALRLSFKLIPGVVFAITDADVKITVDE
jgi:hypothetical protein